MLPPPEHVSHDSQPGISSMLLMVVPAGTAAGLGDGVGVLEGGGVGVDDVVPGGAAELAAAPGAVVVVFSGAEARPPHPAIASKSVPERLVFKSARGTKRICQS